MRRQAINRNSSRYKTLHSDNLNPGITQEVKPSGHGHVQPFQSALFPVRYPHKQVCLACYRYIKNSSPKGSQAAYLNPSMKFSKRIQEDKLTTACILHTYSKSKGKSVLVLQTSQSWFIQLKNRMTKQIFEISHSYQFCQPLTNQTKQQVQF